MAKRVTCPRGHQWEIAADEQSSSTALRVVCPICGAAVDLTDADAPAAIEADAVTLAPSQGAAAADAETLPPGPNPGSIPPGNVDPRAGPSCPVHANIPGYEILEELGRGGMGVVYKARQIQLDRLVALKLLPAATAGDAAFTERFSREARALARLSHPNIVTVHDFGQADGQSYFVMEFIAGSNLRQRLRGGRLPVEEALAIMRQICEALDYAHEEGIVHRDIKPENILLDRKGRVRIADFGLVKLLARKTEDYTLTGPWQVMGTVNYMAPEQFDNARALDHRADIYSAGVVFYEMLTGELPRGRFLLPSEKVVLDPRLDAMVLRAMETDPAQRYQQIKELTAALDGLGSRPPAIPPAPITPATELLTRAEPKDRPIKPWFLTFLVIGGLVFWPVGLVVVVSGVIWLLLGLLRKRDGKGYLRSRAATAGALVRTLQTAFQRVFVSTATWAMLACLAGAAASLQPWVPEAVLYLQLPQGGKDPMPFLYLYTFDSVYGIVPAAVFAGLFLLLVATGFKNLFPLLEALVVLLAGTAIVLSTCTVFFGGITDYLNDPQGQRELAFGPGHGPMARLTMYGDVIVLHKKLPMQVEVTGSDPPRGELEVSGVRRAVHFPPGTTATPNAVVNRMVVSFNPIAYASPILGFLLLFLGALQIRLSLAWSRVEK